MCCNTAPSSRDASLARQGGLRRRPPLHPRAGGALPASSRFSARKTSCRLITRNVCPLHHQSEPSSPDTLTNRRPIGCAPRTSAVVPGPPGCRFALRRDFQPLPTPNPTVLTVVSAVTMKRKDRTAFYFRRFFDGQGRTPSSSSNRGSSSSSSVAWFRPITVAGTVRSMDISDRH